MKTVRANKGEWSEFYAFAKILSEGRLFMADPDLNKMSENFLELVSVSREEIRGKTIVYRSALNKEHVSIFSDGTLLKTVDKSSLKRSVQKVFDEIKSASMPSFESLSGETLMNEMLCTKVKAKSSKKEDITVSIKDRILSKDVELGFSIKSMLGSPSTLLNTSRHTALIYRVSDNVKETDLINKIETSSKVMDRINIIGANPQNIHFLKILSQTFRANLEMIDSKFPEMLGEIVLAYFKGKGKSIEDLVEYLDKEEILSKKFGTTKNIFKYKFKEFLVSVALGMTPAKVWEGDITAHGGYLIVKEDGDIVCYHLYNRDEFKDYLYKNTRLDTPSSSRHDFGKIYTDINGEKCINLNFQIRFKK